MSAAPSPGTSDHALAQPASQSPARGTLLNQSWHALRVAEVVELLGTTPESGLPRPEAHRRLALVGPNEVGARPGQPFWRLVLDQFRSLIVLLLLAAAALAWSLGERAEAIAILAALILNAAIGFGFEWRARRSLARLRALAAPRALVLRGGHMEEIAAAELVPGDVIALEPGMRIAADARLVRSAALRVTEAALTGESEAVGKAADLPLPADTALADRRTMVYLGTTVLAGTGLAVVTATGLATELGRIGQLVQLAGERETPLERQVEQLGRRLVVLGLAVCAMVGVAGILHGEPVWLMLQTAISLAVAAIPEGLPAVTSVALAAGLWRLARSRALVRRLPAVETLGSTTVICADKTGTMTENQMTVTRVHFDGRTLTVSGGPRSPAGRFTEEGREIAALTDPHLVLLLTAAALANDASVEPAGAELALHGDPTEAALLVAAVKAGLNPRELRTAWPRRREIPFDPTARLMATFHEAAGGRRVVFVKGAPGVILERSAFRCARTGSVPLDDLERAAFLESNRGLAAQGLRVLAVAWHDGAWVEPLTGLTLLGLVASTDPVRPEVPGAVARCRRAGIRTIMLTGDQRTTAEAVGRELGLPSDAIHSRVSPEGKLELVAALQRQDEIVAMTGDGVNDAPALARADIGVAMGRQGTDVAREAADLVLTDDNFATIVRAVEEGRIIYANLRKVVHFLFSCNVSEIMTILVALVVGLPSPLLPLQILWVNLVTDILPAIALIRDPPEPDIMTRPPRDPREALVTWTFGGRMLAEGALLAAGVLGAYAWAVWSDGPGVRATTMAFVAVVVIHPLQALSCRSDRLGWWRLPPNRLVWLSLVTLVGLQWAAVTWEPLTSLLHTAPLAAGDWGVVVLATMWPVLVKEFAKSRLHRLSRLGGEENAVREHS